MYIIMCTYKGKQLCLENLTQFYVTPKGSETQHGGGKLHFKLFLTRKMPLVSTELLTLHSKNKDARGIACTLKLNHTNISSAKNLLPPPPPPQKCTLPKLGLYVLQKEVTQHQPLSHDITVSDNTYTLCAGLHDVRKTLEMAWHGTWNKEPDSFILLFYKLNKKSF